MEALRTFNCTVGKCVTVHRYFYAYHPNDVYY